MTIEICRWTSDTCTPDIQNNCVIEFDIDTTIDGSAFNFRRIQTCAPHSVLSGTEDQKITNIRNENTRGGGNVIAEIIADAPISAVDIAIDGTRTLKNGIVVSWAWSSIAPNRVLTITLTGASLTTIQKNSVQAKLDSRFGVGNVVFVAV
jgi:hypothetical protein